MYFILKILFPRGGKFVTTRGNKNFCNIASLKKTSRRKEEDHIRHPLLKW